MKTLLAFVTAWAGASAAAASPAPVPPTYAASPGRARADGSSVMGESSRIADDAAVTITNFSALDNPRDDLTRPRQGIRLAAADQTPAGSKGSPSGKPAIYAHNVNQVIIGKATTVSKGNRPASKAPAIYGHNVTGVVIAGMRTKLPAGAGTSGAPAKPTSHGAIVYNGTITSEPTNMAACGRTAGAHPGGGGVSLGRAAGSRGCAPAPSVSTGEGARGKPAAANSYTKPEPVIIYGHGRN